MIASIYSHPSWGKIQEIKEGGISVTLHAENEDGIIEYAFIKRRAGIIDDTEFFDIVTPRGEYGIVLKEGVLTKRLLEEFDAKVQQYCMDNHVLAEYVRLDPWNQLSEELSAYYMVESHGKEYCVDLEDEDFFKNQFSSKRRNQVRKALSYDLEFEQNVGIEGIDILLDLYQFTNDKYHVSNYYKLDKDFLLRYYEFIADRIFFNIVKYDGIPISAGMFLKGDDVYHYHFSANNPKFAKLNASSAMLYHECKRGADLKCKWFDLGSATVGSGLESFKASMVAETGCFNNYTAKKIRNQLIYDALIKQNGCMPEGYFPAYKRN